MLRDRQKKLDNIQEFMDAWKDHDYHRVHLDPNRWHRRFQEAGYFSVKLSENTINTSTEDDVINWCADNFGNRFAWDNVPYICFWFETERDAVLFALRWA